MLVTNIVTAFLIDDFTITKAFVEQDLAEAKRRTMRDPSFRGHPLSLWDAIAAGPSATAGYLVHCRLCRRRRGLLTRETRSVAFKKMCVCLGCVCMGEVASHSALVNRSADDILDDDGPPTAQWCVLVSVVCLSTINSAWLTNDWYSCGSS